MRPTLERLVWRRAHSRCEYCQLPQQQSTIGFEIEHIVARKHRGKTVASNLALACFYCNTYKGPNIAGIDPRTGRLVRLFHPRRHKWTAHFVWNGPVLVGKTAIGRATIEVLRINHPDAVVARLSLMQEDLFWS